MPFSVVDARAPLAAAASADVERGAKASSSAAKLSAARADVLLLSVIGADDESPAIAAVMIDAEKTAAHAVAAAGSSHMGVLGTSVADSGRRMAVANKVPAGPASKKLSTTLPELVLITGGTSGFGFGFGAAEIYARRGCDVIITSRSRARAHQPLALDLADLRSVVAVVDAYKAAFGTARRLAKLILNAGVVKLVRELSPQGFEATYAANYF